MDAALGDVVYSVLSFGLFFWLGWLVGDCLVQRKKARRGRSRAG